MYMEITIYCQSHKTIKATLRSMIYRLRGSKTGNVFSLFFLFLYSFYFFLFFSFLFIPQEFYALYHVSDISQRPNAYIIHGLQRADIT